MDKIRQLEVREVGDQLWDVVVVGGGPAGAICARVLASRGHRVLVIDKHRFPRHKACGDLLIPDSLTVLARQGLLEQVSEKAIHLSNIHVYSPSQVDFKVAGQYLGLSRFDLDALLMQEAVNKGALFAIGSVCEVETSRDKPACLHLAGSPVTLRCRIAVLATGADIEIPQKLQMIDQPAASAIAIRKYVKSSFKLPDIVLSYDQSLLPGYAWLIPLGNGRYNVGCGVRLDQGDSRAPNLKKMLRKFLDSFPPARKLMAEVSESSKVAGAALRCGLISCREVVRENLVLVGETIGTTFPFTGEGIGKAMHTGELAALAVSEALDEGDLSGLADYPKAVTREIAPHYEGYFQAERWLSRPWLNDLVTRRVRKSRYLRRELESFVAETGDPRSAFGLGGIIKSFWK